MEIVQQLTSSAIGIAAAIVILGLCVFFHETGHFLAAKLFRMRVFHYAIGFGPVLAGRKLGDTFYSIRWFPLGGFVQIAGMEPGEVETEQGFHSRARWQGALVILAGVFMNLVLAMLLYATVAYVGGRAVPGSTGTVIGRIFPGTPAEQGNLQPGDTIVAVDGNRRGMAVEEVQADSPGAELGLQPGDRLLQVGDDLVSAPSDLAGQLLGAPGETRRVAYISATAASVDQAVRLVEIPALSPPAEELSPAVAEQLLAERLGLAFAPMDQADVVTYTSLRPNRELVFTLVREEQGEVDIPLLAAPTQARVLKISPTGQILSPHATVGRIGVVLTAPTEPISLSHAALVGVAESVNSVLMIVDFLRGMIGGSVAAAPGGPLSILAMTYEQSRLGWQAVARFGGFISANLAVINLLPIPPLDGFLLLTLGYEGIVRRRMNARAESLVKAIGFALLMALILALTYNDLTNLIVHGTP